MIKEITLYLAHNIIGYFCISDNAAWLTFWNITACFFIMQKYTPLRTRYSVFFSNLLHYLGYTAILMSIVAYKNCHTQHINHGPLNSGDTEVYFSIILYYILTIVFILCLMIKEKAS